MMKPSVVVTKPLEDFERLRQLARRPPKFGNDIDFVDDISADVSPSYLELLPQHRTDRYGKGL